MASIARMASIAKKGRMRVVFDSSLQYKGNFLNELAWKVPDMTRFRINTGAVIPLLKGNYTL